MPRPKSRVAIAAGVWTIDTEDQEIERREAALPTLEMLDVDVAARGGYESYGVLGGRFTLELRKSRVTVDRGSALDVGGVMGYGEEICSGVHTDEGTTNVCP